ncbi:MAG: archease, partial [Anaerolineae bacterium]|nr:archease [Anaerolineae bacterium]
MSGRWSELDHTADLAVEITGVTLRALFATAANALCALAFEAGECCCERPWRVELSAPDAETLLIAWLNELLYLSEKHNACFSHIDF